MNKNFENINYLTNELNRHAIEKSQVSYVLKEKDNQLNIFESRLMSMENEIKNCEETITALKTDLKR